MNWDRPKKNSEWHVCCVIPCPCQIVHESPRAHFSLLLQTKKEKDPKKNAPPTSASGQFPRFQNACWKPSQNVRSSGTPLPCWDPKRLSCTSGLERKPTVFIQRGKNYNVWCLSRMLHVLFTYMGIISLSGRVCSFFFFFSFFWRLRFSYLVFPHENFLSRDFLLYGYNCCCKGT